MEVKNIYVVMEDKKGNFYQGVVDDSKMIIIGKLVKVYPNNNFTKEFVDKMKRILR